MFFHIFHAIKIIILFLNDVGGFFYIDSYFSFKNGYSKVRIYVYEDFSLLMLLEVVSFI